MEKVKQIRRHRILLPGDGTSASSPFQVWLKISVEKSISGMLDIRWAQNKHLIQTGLAFVLYMLCG